MTVPKALPHELIKQRTKALVEWALQAEMAGHL